MSEYSETRKINKSILELKEKLSIIEGKRKANLEALFQDFIIPATQFLNIAFSIIEKLKPSKQSEVVEK
ncbi:MAG: hypothetical protein KAR08_08135 [Candidatus Heimdallarchaeota archaeon]|nr:hypothetical protein [Candidatus Heimdallarchaeota archaeon]